MILFKLYYRKVDKCNVLKQFRHIKVDTSRIEDIAESPEILKTLQLFDMYMADFYNAILMGVVSIIHKNTKTI